GAAPRQFGDRAQYLRLAGDGLDRIKEIWWNPQADWYTTYPYVENFGKGGLATLWDAFPVFETFALTAIAQPTAERRAAVTQFALGAERYYNPDLEPSGGYSYLPGQRGHVYAYFDDNGWGGLALFEAYRATKNRRVLNHAGRAFRYIDAAGWARHNGGGVWWDTGHAKKTAEPLAAEALLGALLYEATHDARYLATAKRYISWADRGSWNKQRRLYQRNELDPTVLDYVQGMM